MAGAHTPLPGCAAANVSSGTSRGSAWFTSSQLTRSFEWRIGRPGTGLKLDAVIQQSSPTRTAAGSE